MRSARSERGHVRNAGKARRAPHLNEVLVRRFKSSDGFNLRLRLQAFVLEHDGNVHFPRPRVDPLSSSVDEELRTSRRMIQEFLEGFRVDLSVSPYSEDLDD